jgi:hypothetical protein
MEHNNNFKKYFDKKSYIGGEIITMYVNDLINSNKYNNILFIRTPTTGHWLDYILPNNHNITRVYYHTSSVQFKKDNCHKLSIIVELTNLEKKLKELNNTYDLIVIDPYHEYNVSYDNFNLLLSFLKNDGCIISHDCCPSDVKLSTPTPKYIYFDWSGQTYLAFVKLAYNNPELFYSILNIDTGIGIISKTKQDGLKTNLDKYKQSQLLKIDFLNDYDKAYAYFINNSNNIINLIKF